MMQTIHQADPVHTDGAGWSEPYSGPGIEIRSQTALMDWKTQCRYKQFMWLFHLFLCFS